MKPGKKCHLPELENSLDIRPLVSLRINGCWLCKKREWALVEMETAGDTLDAPKSFKRSPSSNLLPLKKYVFPFFLGTTLKVLLMTSGSKRVSGKVGRGHLPSLLDERSRGWRWGGRRGTIRRRTLPHGNSSLTRPRLPVYLPLRTCTHCPTVNLSSRSFGRRSVRIRLLGGMNLAIGLPPVLMRPGMQRRMSWRSLVKSASI